MSKKVVSDEEPYRGEFYSPWEDPTDDFAQHQRWDALALGEVVIQTGSETRKFGPLLPEGVTRYGALQLRCGHAGCGAQIGGVIVTDGPEWQGKPFTYAEVLRVTDSMGRPATGKRVRVILDSVTMGSDLQSECARHGVKAAPVVDVVAALPAGVGKLQRSGKGNPFLLF